MKNPATQSFNEMNTFTTTVKMGDGNIRVRLRNGAIVQPTFYYGIDVEEDFFEVVAIDHNSGYRWYLCGNGRTCNTFDMMEIVT